MKSEELKNFESVCSGMADDALLSEKDSLLNEIEKQKSIHAETSFVLPITFIVVGGVFSFVLIGIPLLVLGIISLKSAIRYRYRSNHAISVAKTKIDIIEETRKRRAAKTEAVEVEAEVILPESPIRPD